MAACGPPPTSKSYDASLKHSTSNEPILETGFYLADVAGGILRTIPIIVRLIRIMSNRIDQFEDKVAFLFN
jgi:hypothetical protein